MAGSGPGRGGRPGGRPHRRDARAPAGPGEPEAPEVGSVIRKLLGEGGMRRGVALGRLHRAWGEVVGEDLARQSAPLALDEGGLLVGASSSAWAAQLKFLSGEVRARCNGVLGRDEVRSVRVVVRRVR